MRAPIGSEAAGAAFKDTWDLTDVDEAWHNEIAETDLPLYKIIDASQYSHGNGMKSYLIMMAVRLIEMKRILKPTGSVYLHCDGTASHYLKALMDAVFGRDNFRNEIIWKRFNFHADARRFGKVSDSLLFYSKTDRYVFKPPESSLLEGVHRQQVRHVDEDGRRFQLDNLNPPGGRGPVYEFHGADESLALHRREHARVGNVKAGFTPKAGLLDSNGIWTNRMVRRSTTCGSTSRRSIHKPKNVLAILLKSPWRC